MHVARPATGQQLAEVQIALVALHQQQHAGQALRVGRHRLPGQRGFSPTQPLHKHLGTQHRLDARAARSLVKLDGTEHVGQVGQPQSGLAVGSGGGHNVIDAKGSVYNGELSVLAQVNKHGLIVGSRRRQAWRQ